MSTSDQQKFDIIIIGAGPIGITCAIEAKKRGLSHLLIDKGALVNTIFRFPTNMTFFSTSKLLEIGEIPFISHQDKPNRREALEYFRRVFESWDLKARLYETVKHIEPTITNGFVVQTDKDSYSASHIVISTGFYDFPNLMNVKGEDQPKVKHYYDEPHPYVGQKVAVIGSANSACDVALELFHKGAEVTMVVRESTINKRVKYWIKPNIENRIKEGSIKAYFNSEVSEIREDDIDIQTPDGKLTMENNFVLAMTGYRPDFKFLKSIGIKIHDDELKSLAYDEETHATNVPGMYVAGVVCGGLKTNKYFIENAKDHATKIMDHILSRPQNASMEKDSSVVDKSIRTN